MRRRAFVAGLLATPAASAFELPDLWYVTALPRHVRVRPLEHGTEYRLIVERHDEYIAVFDERRYLSIALQRRDDDLALSVLRRQMRYDEKPVEFFGHVTHEDDFLMME